MIVKNLATGQELSLPKLTIEQLKALFGEGGYEIVASSQKASDLDSEDKMNLLGLRQEVRKDYITKVRTALEAVKAVRDLLVAEGIVYNGTKRTVACAMHIGNPAGLKKTEIKDTEEGEDIEEEEVTE